MKKILRDLVASFYLSNKIAGDLSLAESLLPIDDEKISGQLSDYYQALSFDGDAYFGDQFLSLVLFPLQSDGRMLESWGLEDNTEWQKGTYAIFAQNTSGDLFFCDLSHESCPVYGMISGGGKHHRLADSLSDFLSFCSRIMALELLDYQGEIYADDDFNIKEDFIDGVSSLIDKSFSGEAREGSHRFFLE